ncbi:MAG: NifB/NifX family molybdenum-iron cluster-binding protein [bacterium]
MTDKFVVAVPSVAPGGLEAETSGHFGHCDLFTLVTVADGKIEKVELQPNIPHEQGGCLAPVNMLAQKSVNVLVAGGMGMRPLVGFNSAGIEVFFNNGLERVGKVMSAFIQGQLPRFTQDNACGGGGDQGGCGGH